MKKKLLCLLVFYFLSSGIAKEFTVTFINPGETGEVFWDLVVDFMKAAAEDLDIKLEVLYSQRDHLKMVDFTKEVVARKNKPDYLIVVNEKLVADQMIQLANSNKIKIFLLLNTLTEEQAKVHGIPREKYPYWIGSIQPDNQRAGLDIARTIFQAAQENHSEKISAVGVVGDYVTPASLQREKGLYNALKSFPQVHLHQIIHSYWNEEKSFSQLQGILRRYPDTRVIWTANDPMALGALRAARKKGLTPGKDIFVGGLNWSSEALDLVEKGELVTSVGGHFMGGGWSLVLLRDYHDGRDFIHTGLEKWIYMGVIEKSNVKNYLKYFGDQNWSKIDFRKFLSLDGVEYDFSIGTVLALQSKKGE